MRINHRNTTYTEKKNEQKQNTRLYTMSIDEEKK